METILIGVTPATNVPVTKLSNQWFNTVDSRCFRPSWRIDGLIESRNPPPSEFFGLA